MKTTSPVMIMVAPNGARKVKADHTNIPLNIEEIAAEAKRCFSAGASIIHLHVRTVAGKHSLDVARYKDAIAAINSTTPDMLVQITTEAVGIYSPQQQADCIRQLMPEFISLAVAEIAATDDDLPFAQELWSWALQQQIRIQHIVYSAQELHRLLRLHESGILKERRLCVLLVLGRYSKGQVSRPEDLKAFLEVDGLQRTDWFTCAFGGQENACVNFGVLQGGHIRIGFENNMLLPNGDVAENTAALVGVAVESLLLAGHTVASVAEARQMLIIR